MPLQKNDPMLDIEMMEPRPGADRMASDDALDLETRVLVRLSGVVAAGTELQVFGLVAQSA